MCCGNKSNVWGILLMVLGLFLLVLSLPYWLWMAVLGLALIIIGFILWRFGEAAEKSLAKPAVVWYNEVRPRGR